MEIVQGKARLEEVGVTRGETLEGYILSLNSSSEFAFSASCPPRVSNHRMVPTCILLHYRPKAVESSEHGLNEAFEISAHPLTPCIMFMPLRYCTVACRTRTPFIWVEEEPSPY